MVPHLNSPPSQISKLLFTCSGLSVIFDAFTQVCDSDTMLDPASSVEMVKVLEEDHMVGGVGGDVQVSFQSNTMSPNCSSRMLH